MRSSWSEWQSAPNLVFASFSIFGCKECNQSDFGVDHLVMSMCSLLLCCWKRLFAMTSAFSWQNSNSLCPASFGTSRPNLPVTPGVSWLPTFAFQSPIMKWTCLLGVSSRRSSRSSQNHSTSASSALVVGGIDLDYRYIEWFALETNRDLSVFFDIAPKYCISDFCWPSQASECSLVLSHHNKDLEWWALKPSACHSSRVLDGLCYST